jgi:putative two-component system response regulator
LPAAYAEDPLLTDTAPDAGLVVVLVDDDVLGLELLRQLVSSIPGVRVEAFPDPRDALAWCRHHRPDVVITDHLMPGLLGLHLLRALRADPGTADVPIMMITGEEDRDLRYAALESGASDVLGKPIDALEVKARTRNMLAIRRGQRLLADRSLSLEAEVFAATAAIAAREHEIVVRLSRAAEFRDWETGSHIVRVSWYSRVIAERLGLPDRQKETIFRAAPMHDVGKIGVPDYILLKAGSLDEGEFEAMKRHTVIGYGILGGSASELLQVAAEVALTHHERWNGTGYPDRRCGEEIPLGGRIVAVADTYDALTSQRPYKKEWPTDLAWEFVRANADTLFDPACVAAFFEGRHDVEDARASFPDLHPASRQPGLEQKHVG